MLKVLFKRIFVLIIAVVAYTGTTSTASAYFLENGCWDGNPNFPHIGGGTGVSDFLDVSSAVWSYDDLYVNTVSVHHQTREIIRNSTCRFEKISDDKVYVYPCALSPSGYFNPNTVNMNKKPMMYSLENAAYFYNLISKTAARNVEHERKIAGIKKDDTRATVIGILGQPLSSKKVYNYSYEQETENLSYYDIEICLIKDKVVSMSTKKASDRAVTPDGIRVGSTVNEMLGIYGNPTRQPGGSYIYGSSGNTLVFFHKNGIITDIACGSLDG